MSMQVLVIEDDLDVFEVVSLSLDMLWPDANVLSAPTGELGLAAGKSRTARCRNSGHWAA